MQKMLGFTSSTCVFWRSSLEIIQYDMGRSVQKHKYESRNQENKNNEEKLFGSKLLRIMRIMQSLYAKIPSSQGCVRTFKGSVREK